jgi:hypothetical protein
VSIAVSPVNPELAVGVTGGARHGLHDQGLECYSRARSPRVTTIRRST